MVGGGGFSFFRGLILSLIMRGVVQQSVVETSAVNCDGDKEKKKKRRSNRRSKQTPPASGFLFFLLFLSFWRVW